MSAKVRKHRTALIALAVFHFAVFFPLIFMGRVVSPNDVFYAYEPWASHRPPSIDRIQNALMSDPPTAWLPLMTMLKTGAPAFHWDPYIGSGVPGFASAGSALLSPLVLIPTLVLPLTWVYTGIILAKIHVAFWFAYAWLREERLGKVAGAVGAIVIAGAGVYSTRWLWQSTNATVLYPALLWIVRRGFSGKRTPVAIVALIALSYALSGFPSSMAYGAYLAIAYALFLAVRERRLPLMRAGEVLGGVLIAAMIAAPFLVPFAQFIRRSGYLAAREEITSRAFPLSHWRSFFDPDRLGHPTLKSWIGDPALVGLNNYLEATVFVGVLTIPLAVLGVAHLRRRRWFWIVAAVVFLLIVFGVGPIARVAASAPGIKYTPLGRLSLVLPIAAGFLAATGTALLLRVARYRRLRPLIGLACAGVIAWELGVFAGKFHPYLAPAAAAVPHTHVTDFLRREPQPYRFAAFLTYLWPNGAQLYGVEDIASHFASESEYRRLMSRIDPTAWTGQSTVITFNSLKFNFSDPLVSMLGVRYFLEHRAIDIIKWTIFAATKPVSPDRGAFVLPSGTIARRTIRIDEEPFWAVEVPMNIETVNGALPRVDMELTKGGTTVWSRTFSVQDVSAMNKLYVPIRPYARIGETVEIRLWSSSMHVRLPRADGPDGETGFYYGRVTVPFIFDRELPDGRVFRNLNEVPRFQAVKRIRKLNDEEFLLARDINFAEEAVITDDPVFPPESVAADATAALKSYAAAEQRIETNASGPMFLASSEKLTPELRITIDGRRARPIEINTMFAGVVVPAGRHEVVFERRIGRGWWPLAIAGLVLFFAALAGEVIAVWRRSRIDRRAATATRA